MSSPLPSQASSSLLQPPPPPVRAQSVLLVSAALAGWHVAAVGWHSTNMVLHLAVDETVILLTLSLHHY